MGILIIVIKCVLTISALCAVSFLVPVAIDMLFDRKKGKVQQEEARAQMDYESKSPYRSTAKKDEIIRNRVKMLVAFICGIIIGFVIWP